MGDDELVKQLVSDLFSAVAAAPAKRADKVALAVARKWLKQVRALDRVDQIMAEDSGGTGHE